ncbi:MAG TPA: ABC transporter ATP-binding protein [Ilumatobacter sp.]
MSQGAPIIVAAGLTMQFGAQRALDALDVQVPSGVTGLVGANGAGKTTFMSIVLGLRVATSGDVEVLGLDPAARGPELRALVGYGPERNVFPDEMPASDFVRHLAEVRGMPRTEARGRASDALWLVGLGEERFRPLGTMSTGQRQRVKLAQALAADPALVLLDEPTDGLDPVQRDEMLVLIRQISTDYGIDVLLSSHLLEEVERVCDHVVVLDAGRLVAQGRLDVLVGHEDGVVVELVEVPDRSGALAAVVAAIELAGLSVRPGSAPSRIEVLGDDADLVADTVRDAIAAAGARVGRIVRRRRRLDDLFEGAPR